MELLFPMAFGFLLVESVVSEGIITDFSERNGKKNALRAQWIRDSSEPESKPCTASKTFNIGTPAPGQPEVLLIDKEWKSEMQIQCHMHSGWYKITKIELIFDTDDSTKGERIYIFRKSEKLFSWTMTNDVRGTDGMIKSLNPFKFHVKVSAIADSSETDHLEPIAYCTEDSNI